MVVLVGEVLGVLGFVGLAVLAATFVVMRQRLEALQKIVASQSKDIQRYEAINEPLHDRTRRLPEIIELKLMV